MIGEDCVEKPTCKKNEWGLWVYLLSIPVGLVWTFLV